jgi:hypothetical protein
MIEVFQKFQMPLMGLRAFKYMSHILPLLSLSKKIIKKKHKRQKDLRKTQTGESIQEIN